MIRTKLEILKQNSVLEQSSHDSLLLILDTLIEQNIIQDDQQADFFLTHLAMACARNAKNENVNPLDDNLRQEIIENEHYRESQILWNTLEKQLPLTFHESELDYIHLHLVNFLNAR